MLKLFCTLLVSMALALADAPSAVAIRDAKIVPVSGATIANGTVVIRNGLIEAVGANVQIPADAWVIDGKGLTVYPGLIDGLSRWGIPEAAPAAGAAAAAAGRRAGAPAAAAAANPNAPPPARGPEDRPSTSSWVSAADQLSTADRRIETFRSIGYTTAVTFPNQGIIAGQGAVVNLAGDKPNQMVVVSPVGQYLTMRSDGGGFPNSLMGVMSYIRQVYMDADYYKKAKEAYAQNPRGMARPAYDRALEGLLASPRVLLPASRGVEITRMSRFAAELHQPVVLYGVHEGYRVAGDIKLPVLVSLKWPEKARDADPDDIESLRVLEVREQAATTPTALAKAGVKFGFYSDGIDRPADLMKAVKKAIDAGLSADQAIRAMTLSVAEIFGVEDRTGSIEKGKIANLLVTKGDLFQDKTEVQYIFVDGTKFEPAPDEQQTPAAGGFRRPSGGDLQ